MRDYNKELVELIDDGIIDRVVWSGEARSAAGKVFFTTAPIKHICPHCGAEFEGAPHAKYCSDRCRLAAFAKRRKATIKAKRER
jgi:endogenous inhibitor of DNA gyrase (YacG/DUF329 family)